MDYRLIFDNIDVTDSGKGNEIAKQVGVAQLIAFCCEYTVGSDVREISLPYLAQLVSNIGVAQLLWRATENTAEQRVKVKTQKIGAVKPSAAHKLGRGAYKQPFFYVTVKLALLLLEAAKNRVH